MAKLSIEPGFIPHCKNFTHGAIAAAILSSLSKSALKGDLEGISLSDLATMTASKLDDVVTTCSELSAKGLLVKNVAGPWSAVSTIIPHRLVIEVAVSQKDLFGEPGAAKEATSFNPLGLFEGHDYRRLDGRTMTFQDWDEEAGIYRFHSADPELGSLPGDEGWVRATFIIEGSSIARVEGLSLPELNEEGLRIERVSPEVFAELAAEDASKSLKRAKPAAKNLVRIAEGTWAVTGVLADRVYLTPCRLAEKDEEDGDFFTHAKARWRLGAAGDRIVAMLATVEETVDAAPGDPMEFVRALHGRGFANLELNPPSFTALWNQIWPDQIPELDKAIQVDNGPTVRCVPEGGLDIDGYAEPTRESCPEVKGEPQIEIENWTAHWTDEVYEDRGVVEVFYKKDFQPETDLFVFAWPGGHVNHRVESSKVPSDIPLGEVVTALVIALVPTLESRAEAAV